MSRERKVSATSAQTSNPVPELLLSKSHIEARDSSFMTALHHACENGHLLVADALLRKGANVESAGRGSKLPLIFAASSGNIQVAEPC
jgi:ankyrin repeat protein